jgi:sec-independent protein translocase protein TatB
MLDIGWSELLVVAVVAIVIVGPKDLPRLMRTFGHYARKLRSAAADFQRQFEGAMAESEAEEVRKNIESIRSGLGPPVRTPTPSSIEQAIPPGAEPRQPAPRKTAARKTATRKAAPQKKKPAPKGKPVKRRAKAKAKTKSKTKTGRKS